ncbi:MAG: hypothetical protein LBC88_02320 [Spirochaetaceae bacterium]|jgi:hypothetical protein|nr:hypothetical protein [Spirochaetaceae bacterium]
MSSKRREIIALIVLDVILIFCTLFAHHLYLKNNANENLTAETVIDKNGSLTIKIFIKPGWKIALVYLLSFSMSGAIILSIINIGGYIGKKEVPLKNKAIIILSINMALTILLFPVMTKFSLIMYMVIIAVFMAVKLMNKIRHRKNNEAEGRVI